MTLRAEVLYSSRQTMMKKRWISPLKSNRIPQSGTDVQSALFLSRMAQYFTLFHVQYWYCDMEYMPIPIWYLQFSSSMVQRTGAQMGLLNWGGPSCQQTGGGTKLSAVPLYNNHDDDNLNRNIHRHIFIYIYFYGYSFIFINVFSIFRWCQIVSG